MTLYGVNVWAVLVAGVLYWVLGALWYGAFFNRPFVQMMQEAYPGHDKLSESFPPKYVLTLIADMAAAAALAAIFVLGNVTDVLTGLGVSQLVWLALVAGQTLVFAIFEGPSLRLWALHNGYASIGFAIMGVLLAVWR